MPKVIKRGRVRLQGIPAVGNWLLTDTRFHDVAVHRQEVGPPADLER
jgi:hypothetical protein